MLIFGKNLSEKIQSVLSGKNVFAVTDENVMRLYPGLFMAGRTFVLKPGEARKNLNTVADICAFLVASGADRQSKLIAVGGGVVGDVAGFSASVYKRGIPWVNVPTTLLALCDSGIGGKTGVDFESLKNIIGTFHFPQEIYLSAHFIKTLDNREYLCGVGEIIKTACLSPEIFEFYVKHEKQVCQKDDSVLEKLIRLCAEFKQSVVERDPHETTGLRKILNYGHTVGHAFETADNHSLSHGEYILYGMFIESLMCGDMIDPVFFAVAERMIKNALGAFGAKSVSFDARKSAIAAMSDKKNADNRISVIAVVKPGETREVFFSKEEFEKKIKDFIHG